MKDTYGVTATKQKPAESKRDSGASPTPSHRKSLFFIHSQVSPSLLLLPLDKDSSKAKLCVFVSHGNIINEKNYCYKAGKLTAAKRVSAATKSRTQDKDVSSQRADQAEDVQYKGQ